MEAFAPVAPQAAAKPAPQARFTRRQRFLLRLITWAGYLLIRVLGATLRFTVSTEEGAPAGGYTAPGIFAFWHRCLIPACFRWQRRKIAVLTSRSFDGEYIARILEAYGYTPVRGSSTRGGVGALLGMQQELESGHAVGFTIDGPKGPRY
ncbi:MAG: lysophospholipid acyltransferase family protein, partial [Terriglobales bacterium]